MKFDINDLQPELTLFFCRLPITRWGGTVIRLDVDDFPCTATGFALIIDLFEYMDGPDASTFGATAILFCPGKLKHGNANFFTFDFVTMTVHCGLLGCGNTDLFVAVGAAGAVSCDRGASRD